MLPPGMHGTRNALRRSSLCTAALALLVLCSSASAATPLLGDRRVERVRDRAGAGFAQAFRYTAVASGTTRLVRVYVSRAGTATGLEVGLYSSRSGRPSMLLASGSRSGLKRGGWNDVRMSPAAVRARARYWIALLGAGGALSFRDRGSGARSYGQSADALPATWSSMESWATGPASAYVIGSRPLTREPTAPTGLSATPGDRQVWLSWHRSTDSVRVAGYRVYRNGSFVARTRATHYRNTGLTNGRTYRYSVVAYDAAGRKSAHSAIVKATPHETGPATPHGTGPGGSGAACPVAQPQATWAPVGRPPLTDAQAAACVQHRPESRPGNAGYNDFVPSPAEEQAWQGARAGNEHNPEVVHVDGLDGLPNPSTDDLIQWASYKWGIPTDWVRAAAVVESYWRQTSTGDLMSVSATAYQSYPMLARASGPSCSSGCRVWRSLGLMSVAWTSPPTEVDVGTEPLRWESTAFNLDYYASVVRWYYDGHCSWCGSGYGPGEQWPSIGGWYDPFPWQNSGAVVYVSKVQSDLRDYTWAQPGF